MNSEIDFVPAEKFASFGIPDLDRNLSVPTLRSPWLSGASPETSPFAPRTSNRRDSRYKRFARRCICPARPLSSLGPSHTNKQRHSSWNPQSNDGYAFSQNDFGYRSLKGCRMVGVRIHRVNAALNSHEGQSSGWPFCVCVCGSFIVQFRRNYST